MMIQRYSILNMLRNHLKKKLKVFKNFENAQNTNLFNYFISCKVFKQKISKQSNQINKL